MRRLGSLAATCAALTAIAAAPARATTTPAPAETPAGTPVAGKMRLQLARVGGSPPFAFVRRRVSVQGIVWPYVGGQAVKLSFYLRGRKVGVKVLRIVADGSGAGRFHSSFASSTAGELDVHAAHYATAQQAAFAARTPAVRFIWPDLGPGSQGQSVRVLQSELDVLHYAVPLSGTLDEGTGQALIAFRKMAGLARIPYAGREVFERIAHGGGRFHVRFPGDGRHVEADLTRQVLAEIEPGGRVRRLYTMSSGKPSTPTVIGHFNVYLKTPGVNSESMVDSNYFIRGYAIHGYPEVPTYAASHGCLWVPIPDVPAIFSWVQYGTSVDVYNENGGGSGRVRSNAGP
jgi:hypothetical protein